MGLALIVLQLGLSLAGMICLVGAYQVDAAHLDPTRVVIALIFFAAAFVVRIHRWTRRRGRW